MCEYCKNVFTEDHYQDLFEFPIRISVGDTEHDAGYFSGGIESDGLEVSIAVNDLYFGETVLIKFCPMCGEDLTRLKELAEGVDCRRKAE